MLVFNAYGVVQTSVTRQLADQVAVQRYRDAEFSSEEAFVDLSGVPSARAYVYKLVGASPDRSGDYDTEDARWGVDRYATVITAARYSQNPVAEISNSLPAWIANRSKAETRALELWPGLDPRITGYVYLAPLDEWFEVTTTEGKKYLHSRELTEYDLSKLAVPQSAEGYAEGAIENAAWHAVSQGGYFLEVKSKKITDVPYALWSYGCSPTASSMILDYWDRRGYPLLVDYYFDRWDNVEQETDYDLTNAHMELATGMHTDSMIHGGTGTAAITSGNLYVTNGVHGYSFSGSTISSSNSANFGAVISEIDAGRPVHWSVGNYLYQGERIYHSICAIGYDITASNDSLIVIHNTWDKAEHSWAYQTSGSYSDVYPLIPGGAVKEDLRLKDFYAYGNYYKGIKYPIMMQKAGSIPTIKVWLSKTDNKSTWQLIANLVKGEDYVLADMSDDFVGKRMNVEGYSGDKLVAADGTPFKIGLRDFPAVDHFTPKGHMISQGYPIGRSIVYGDIAYVMQGYDRLIVVELHDDYLVPKAVLTPHTISSFAVEGGYLYVLGNDSLTLYDIANPASPVLESTVKLASSYKSIAAYSGFVYLGCENSPILAMRRDNNQLLDEVNVPESTVTSLDVIEGKLYVSSGSAGVSVYDLSSPGAPVFEKKLATKKSSAGVAKYKTTLVVSEGSGGFEMIDLSSGQSQVFSPGTVADLKVAADRIYVAAKQSGFFIYKITGSTSASLQGQFSALSGPKEGIALGKYLYLSCGFDGFFALQTDLTGIDEPVRSLVDQSINVSAFIRPGASLGSLELHGSADVSVSLFDVTGRRLMAESRLYGKGINTLPAVPGDLAAGVYFVAVATGVKSYRAKVVVTN